MKKLTLLIVLVANSCVLLAQLPSWGMTETQFKMPNRDKKLSEIGEQAVKNQWQLTVNAPKDWHAAIRSGLTQKGETNVMMVVKDSMHKSVSISASKAKQLGRTVTPSESNTVVKKQAVVDDQIEIDTSVERPDFGDDFNTKQPAMADVGLDISLPKNDHQVTKSKKQLPKKKHVNKPKTSPKPAQKTAQKPVPAPSSVTPKSSNEVKTEPAEIQQVASTTTDDSAARTYLRKRYAKNKKINGTIRYPMVKTTDDLYIKDGVVLVIRKKNGQNFFYWMKEGHDPVNQAIKSVTQERYEKTEPAVEDAAKQAAVEEQLEKSRVNLSFVAVTDQLADQDLLRQQNTRNKRVSKTIKPTQLKAKDQLFVRNETVLVVRSLSRNNVIYFWLKGDASTISNAKMKRNNEFVIE